MKYTKPLIRPLLIVILALLLFATEDAPIAQAHNFTAFLGSPYYGCLNGCQTPFYSQRWTATHAGIDFLLRWGSVLATANGNLEFSGWQNSACHDSSQAQVDPNCTVTSPGFGLYARLSHTISGETNYSYYGHLSVVRTNLGAVTQGEWLGTSGNSGYSSGPHLHFEVRHGCQSSNCAVNPDDPNNDGNFSDSLWQDGEWAGNIPANSKARRRYVTLGTYGDTIIDDTDNNSGGFVKGRAGSLECPPNTCQYWTRVTTGGYTGDYYYTLDSNSTEDYWARWAPSLPTFSNYELSAYIPCTPDSASEYNTSPSWSAPYQIQHVDGTSTVRVDQLTLSRSGVCNRWISLGVYRGQATLGFTVRLTDATGETGMGINRKVLVDAVKFTRINVGGFEAENYRKKTTKNNRQWTPSSNVIGASNNTYMIVATTGGTIDQNIEANSPDMKFNLVFPTAGTFYVWLRGNGSSTSDDSIHAGKENQVESTAQYMTCAGWSQPNTWVWCKTRNGGQPATLSIPSPGRVTFNLYMRDDGFRADKIILTADSNYNAQTTPTTDTDYIFPGDDMSE